MTQESIVLNTTPPYSGADLVADVNDALQSLGTDFAGPTDPAAVNGVGPYMTWADIANGLLKRRNAAGTGWVTLGPLFAELATKSSVDSAATAAGTSFEVNPAGNISATNVQGALEELDAEKQAALGYTPVNKAGDTMSGNLGIGSAVFRTDGDVQGSAWGGGFLSSAVNSKAAAGATVKHLSSTVEFSNIYLPTAGTYDLPADYVLTGIRSTGAGSEFVLRGRTLRNE